MAAEGNDDIKPVEEVGKTVEGPKGSENEVKHTTEETNDRVESAKKLVEEAKRSVEDLMKSVEGKATGKEVQNPVGQAGQPTETDKDPVQAGSKPAEEEAGSATATESPSPTPGDVSEPTEFMPTSEPAPNARRPATPIPFSRSSDGTETPVSRGRVSPEEPQTPRAPRTPPPLTTRSLGKVSEDGLKTPSDLSGHWTPSTPKTPGHASSADSIRRKPVPAPSQDNLRDRSEGRASTLRNPLEKTTVTIMPERLGEKAPSTPDSTPRTHISLPGKKKRGVKWRRVGRQWWVEGAWCSASLLCIISEFNPYSLVALRFWS